MMTTKEYQAGLKFMLINAVKKLYNGEVIFDNSLDKGICATVISDNIIDDAEAGRIKKCMENMVKKNLPFNRKTVGKKDAYDFYMKKGYKEKANNVLNISNITVTLYELEGQYNYLYSHNMPVSTGELSLFDIKYVEPNELILIYPTNNELKYTFRNKIYYSFASYEEWLEKQHIEYLTDINALVSQGKIADFMKKNDLKIDSDLLDIAKTIIKLEKKIVFLAGPSSSGKTTSSKKLSLYLSSLGANAMPMSLDDFFLNRDQTPLDEEGKRDYECVEALDLELFSDTLNKLLDGEAVKLPTYNFLIGKKEFNDDPVTLNENDILVIEGLHGLNPKILQNIKDENTVYKVYISPLTALNVDRHNYVSTTDNRLLRRIVRDFRTRGRSAEASIATWPSVRAGEEKHIFPYTDTADALLNTAYSYELGVLKIYVEPLLYSIPMESSCYQEARRLLDNLKAFYTIPSEYVEEDNLLREFIGGSVFEK